MPWRKILKNNFRNLKELALFLELDLSKLGHPSHFPLNVPRRLAEKMEKGTIDDPIFRQFVPLPEEGISTEGFVLHPVQDMDFCKSSKLLQKYEGRALLLSTSACAMHCRFCFRQHYPYSEKKDFDAEIEIIKKEHSLKEIILSGGDPLSLNNEKLKELFDKLEQIEHVRIIRFHTRFPIGIPERIDAEFLHILQKCSKQCVFILHLNHPREFDQDVLSALKSLQKLGIPVFITNVLLRGVNDDFDTLKKLYEISIENGMIPYYMHQLDKVEGASHFEVPEERGLELIEQLRIALPGYALPKYVKEIPGNASKTPI